MALKKLSLLVVLAAALVGCGSSEQAEGWSADNKRLFDALEKAGGDVNKLSPEDRAAYEKLNPKGSGGMTAPGPGGAAAPPAGTASGPATSSSVPPGYATPNGPR